MKASDIKDYLIIAALIGGAYLAYKFITSLPKIPKAIATAVDAAGAAISGNPDWTVGNALYDYTHRMQLDVYVFGTRNGKAYPKVLQDMNSGALYRVEADGTTITPIASYP